MKRAIGRTVVVEFRYFDKSTCSRCRTTDTNVEKTVKVLRKALGESKVKFKTTKIPASRMSESNAVLVNGKDVEELVNGHNARRSTPCRGCGVLTNSPCNCRAYSYRKKRYRYVPRAMILQAVKKAQSGK